MSAHEAFISKATPRRAEGRARVASPLKTAMAQNLSLAPGTAGKRRGLGPLGSRQAKVGAKVSALGAGRRPGVGHLAPKPGVHRPPKLGEVMESRTGDAGRALKQGGLIDRGMTVAGGSSTVHGAGMSLAAEKGTSLAAHGTEALTHSHGLGHAVEAGLTVAHHLLMKSASGHDAFGVRCA